MMIHRSIHRLTVPERGRSTDFAIDLGLCELEGWLACLSLRTVEDDLDGRSSPLVLVASVQVGQAHIVIRDEPPGTFGKGVVREELEREQIEGAPWGGSLAGIDLPTFATLPLRLRTTPGMRMSAVVLARESCLVRALAVVHHDPPNPAPDAYAFQLVPMRKAY